MELIRETEWGEIWDMTNAQYHASDPWSHSKIKHLNKSPRHFKWKLDNPEDPSPDMSVGSGAHYAILEPDKFSEMVFALPPDWDARKKADREMRDESFKEYPDKVILTQENIMHCWGMAKAVEEHLREAPSAMVQNLLKKGVAESSFFTKILGLDVKVRPDWLPEDLPLIVDLKTTKNDARKDAFQRVIQTLSYHQSAALQHDVITRVLGESSWELWWLVVEQEPPYGVMIHKADPTSLTIGQVKYIECLQKLDHCLKNNVWPAYDHHIRTTGLPGWAIKQEGYYE
jgi:exodeoxyribonuclease VIII